MTDATDSPRSVVAWALAFVALLVALVPLSWFVLRKPVDHWEEVARARAYLDRGQPDLAFEAVASIRDEAPGTAEALALAGKAMLMKGTISVAKRCLERSLQLKPEQPEAAKMLAAIYLASGDGVRGLTLLKQAAEQDPHDFRPWFAMGKVHHDLGNLAESADAFAQALERRPPEPEATESRLGRIRALLDASRDEEATADLDEARRHAPHDPRVLGLAARQASDLGRSAEALDLANRSLAADPDNFDSRLVRARLHYLAGQSAEALDDVDQATRINPNHLGALQLLGQVQSRLGQSEEAARTQERFHQAQDRLALMDRLTKEINRSPDDPEPRWLMGLAAVEGGLDTLAYQCFQAALDIDPHHKPSREALAELEARKQASGEGPPSR